MSYFFARMAQSLENKTGVIGQTIPVPFLFLLFLEIEFIFSGQLDFLVEGTKSI